MKPEHKRILAAAQYLIKKNPNLYIYKKQYYLYKSYILCDRNGYDQTILTIEDSEYSPIQFPWQKEDFSPKEPKMKDGMYTWGTSTESSDDNDPDWHRERTWQLATCPEEQDRFFQRNPKSQKEIKQDFINAAKHEVDLMCKNYKKHINRHRKILKNLTKRKKNKE